MQSCHIAAIVLFARNCPVAGWTRAMARVILLLGMDEMRGQSRERDDINRPK